MTSEATFLRRMRRLYLSQGRSESRNKLAAALTDTTATTVTFTYDMGRIVAGAIISIGHEDMYVYSIDATAKSAIVERGSDGSAAATHAVTDPVRVAPRYSDATILDAANAALLELNGRGCYRMLATQLTFNPAIVGYDLSIGASSQVYDVQGQDYAHENWTRLEDWTVERKEDTTDFASGIALFLRGGAYSGRLVQVRYKAPFGTMTADMADIETTTGLPTRAMELLQITTALGLLAGREVARNFSEVQGPTRRSEEVQAGAEVQSLRPLVSRQRDLLAAELRLLVKEYPNRRKR